MHFLFQFIAHPHCQQVMEQVWFEGLPDWVKRSSVQTVPLFFYVAMWVLAWPFLCLAFMFKIHPWFITFMKAPINKFISDTISFLIFLGLLLANVVITMDVEDVQGQIFNKVSRQIYSNVHKSTITFHLFLLL